MLRIHTPNRIYVFSHENPQELITWTEVLEKYIKLTSITSLASSSEETKLSSPPQSQTPQDSQWIQYFTDDNIPYWHNPTTGETSWNPQEESNK